jgi:hypothetical protein
MPWLKDVQRPSGSAADAGFIRSDGANGAAIAWTDSGAAGRCRRSRARACISRTETRSPVVLRWSVAASCVGSRPWRRLNALENVDSTSGALLSSDDYGSSVERAATLHPLWQGRRWWQNEWARRLRCDWTGVWCGGRRVMVLAACCVDCSGASVICRRLPSCLPCGCSVWMTALDGLRGMHDHGGVWAVLPVVGHEREVQALGDLIDQIRERGGALVVRGEAGIGKSARLSTAGTRGNYKCASLLSC